MAPPGKWFVFSDSSLFRTSTCSTSYESKELIDKNNDKDPEPAVSQSSVFLQLGKDKQQAISKKLSVVPEQDEQVSTFTLIIFTI